MRLRPHLKLPVLSLGLLVFAASCATTVTRHPDFGRDCADFDANVDCVRVFYGTNRGVMVGGKGGKPGGAEQDVTSISGKNGGVLVVGRADIWLPLLVQDGGDREIGETPMVKGDPPSEQTEQEKFVFITRITASGKQHFVRELQGAMDERGVSSIMLFVHGFNVKFDDALIRSAQLVVDLREGADFNPGAPTLFSWPSAGKVAPGTYRGDQARSLEAAPYLTEFLNLLTGELEVDRVNIIAHSMGNRTLIGALEEFAATYLEMHPDKDIEFRIVLAAADVDRAEFDRIAAEISVLDPEVTIYTSDNDMALNASKLLNKFAPRLGDTDGNKPYIRNDLGFITVDATPVATELFGLGHSYYSDNPFILNDIKCAMADTPPGARALAEHQYADEPDGNRFFRTLPDAAAGDSSCNLQRQNFLIPEGDFYGFGESMANGQGAGTIPTRDSGGPGTGLGAGSPPPPPPPPAATASPPPMVAEELIVRPESSNVACAAMGQTFDVYFGWDQADLSRQAQAVIEQVVMQTMTGGCSPEAVLIAGYTDTSGGDAYNQALSARRVDAVAVALEEYGIPVDIIHTQANGETGLAKATEDGVREPLNRRSEITIIVR